MSGIKSPGGVSGCKTLAGVSGCKPPDGVSGSAGSSGGVSGKVSSLETLGEAPHSGRFSVWTSTVYIFELSGSFNLKQLG